MEGDLTDQPPSHVLDQFPKSIFNNQFLYDLNTNTIVKNIDNPNLTEENYLFLANNKYLIQDLKPEEIGKWMIFANNSQIITIWDKVKEGIMNGHLYQVSISSRQQSDGSANIVCVFTKSFEDVEDVIKVLDYIEDSGIKPPEIDVIKYKRDKETTLGVFALFGHRSSIYHSSSIRNGERYTIDADRFWSFYMLEDKTFASECNFKPTEISDPNILLLYARNNAYDNLRTIQHDFKRVCGSRFGKWLIKTNENNVNNLWNKVQNAVKEGHFWYAQVTTKHPGYKIFIYIADCTDIDEAIDFLDNIEAIGILPHTAIRFYNRVNNKPDPDCNAGSFISHTSSTIRNRAFDKSMRDSEKDGYSFVYNCQTSDVISAGTLRPSEILTKQYRHMFAKNNKYPESEIIRSKVGFWTIRVLKPNLDDTWECIKEGITKGALWYAKITNLNNIRSCEDPETLEFGLFIYTKDGFDVEDVINTLNYLEAAGIKPRNSVVYYDTNKPVSLLETDLDRRSEPSYTSDTIRDIRLGFRRNGNGRVPDRHSSNDRSSQSNWRSRSNNYVANNKNNNKPGSPLSWRKRD